MNRTDQGLSDKKITLAANEVKLKNAKESALASKNVTESEVRDTRAPSLSAHNDGRPTLRLTAVSKES